MRMEEGFNLDEYCVLPLEGRISRGEYSQHIQPKTMDVLLVLAVAAPAVVSREEILRQVWGERAQSDEPLTRCIGELRRALQDGRDQPRYILTIPKRGYQLLVTPRAAAAARPNADRPSQRIPYPFTTFAAFSIAVAFVLTGSIAWWNTGNSIDELESATELIPNAPSQSLAVLPFVNMSPDPDQSYFADGVTEEILNALAGIDELRVTSRSSAFVFKDQPIDVRSVANQLNVAHILEGSVRKEGSTVRIAVQLIDAATDSPIWTDSFDRELTGILQLQREIAKAVATRLQIEILGDTPSASEIHPDAYMAYLQALQLSYQRTPQAFVQSIALYERALQLAPTFPEAWNSYATNLRRQTQLGVGNYEDGYARARDAAQRAIQLDPNFAPAIANLGRIAIDYEGNFDMASEYISRALQLRPTDDEVNNSAAVLAFTVGRPEQAITMGERLVARDPLNPTVHSNLGLYYLYAGRYEDAISTYTTALALSPGRAGAHFEIGIAQLLLDRPADALTSFQQEIDDEWRTKGVAAALFDLGRETEFAAALATLIEGWGERWPSEVAHVYAWSGDFDAAFTWLDRAVENGEAGLRTQFQRPLLRPLHGDPRWQEFLARTRTRPSDLAVIDF